MSFDIMKRERIARLVDNGFLDEAIDGIHLEIEEDPDNGELFELLGLTFHLNNDVQNAIRALETASILGPLETNSQMALAECYVSKHFYESACAIYDFLISRVSTPEECLPDIAKGYSRMRKHYRALETCRISVERNPDCDKALFGMAFYKARCGHSLSSVVSILERAISLDPHSIDYRVVAASLCLQRDQRNSAARILEPITRQDLDACDCSDCIRRLVGIASCLEMTELVNICQARLSAERIQ